MKCKIREDLKDYSVPTREGSFIEDHDQEFEVVLSTEAEDGFNLEIKSDSGVISNVMSIDFDFMPELEHIHGSYFIEVDETKSEKFVDELEAVFTKFAVPSTNFTFTFN